LAPRRHGRLLFRTYLVIVGGLIATAALFDYGFARLQESQAPSMPGAWVRSTLTLIERRLGEVALDERPAVLAELERELGLPIGLLPADAVVHADGGAAGGTSEIFDDAGRSIFLRTSEVLDAAIRVGPVADDASPQNRWLNLAPHLFYLTIFVLVGVWLWPLIRDVDLLNRAARAFAADYRTPMTTRDKATTLEELAGSFDEMSARIRAL